MKFGIYLRINKLIIKSKVWYAILSSSLLLTILFCYFSSLWYSTNELYIVSNLRLFIIPPIISNTMLIANMATTLFSTTKINNVDLYLYTKPVKKSWILYMKELSVFSVSLLNLLAQIIIYMSFMLSWNIDNYFIFTSLGLTLLGGILFNALFVVVFVFITSSFKQVFGLVASAIIALIICGSLSAPLFMQTKVKDELSYNKTLYHNNYLKAVTINDVNQIEKLQNGIEILSGNESNKSFNVSDKTPISKYDPSQFFSSPFDIFLSNFIDYKLPNTNVHEISSNSDKWSYKMYEMRVQSDEIEAISGEVFYVPFNIQSPIEMTSEQIEFKVKELIQIYSKNETTVKDKEYWRLLKEKLSSNEIWLGQLTVDQVKHISYFAGLEKESMFYWYLMNQWDYLSKKTSKLESLIKSTYSSELYDFINFIWTSPISYLNIRASESIKSYDEIKEMHPISMRYNQYSEALVSDIEYIRKTLVYLNADINGTINSFKVLNQKGVYVDVSDISSVLNAQITTRKEWNDYLDNNKPIVNLKDMLNKINSDINGELASFTFKDNEPTNDLINDTFTIELVDGNKMLIWYFTILTMVITFMQGRVRKKITRRDIL